jgi:hypothetical protein
MVPLADVPEPPPIAVPRHPMSGILVQSLPVLIIQQVSNDDREGDERPIPHEEWKDIIS